MIKVDIVNEVSRLAEITKVKAEVAVDAVFDAMRASMMRGERIELRGFGVFQVKPRKRGIGRNPRTGKEVQHPARPDHPLQARARNCRTSAASRSEHGPTRHPDRRARRRSRSSQPSTLDRRPGSARAAAEVPAPLPAHIVLFLLTFVTTTFARRVLRTCGSSAGQRRHPGRRCFSLADASRTACGTRCRCSRSSARHEFGHYFVLPQAQRGRDAALLPAGAAAAHRHARRGHPHPGARFRRSARSSTSASPGRSPASSRCCRSCSGACCMSPVRADAASGEL